MAHCEADRVTKEPPDRGKDGVLEEEFPALSGAAKGVTPPSGAAQAAPLYSERLKSNVKYDQRLKRNVLEICLEKTERSSEIVLNGDTIARILKSLKMNIENELEGVQVQYGRIPIIHAWCKPNVNLDKFCSDVGIKISDGLSTGHIRPAARRDVVVTVQGLNFNTPDGLVIDYIQKFGGQIVSQEVVYKKYKEGLLAGKYTGDRQYQVLFEESSRKMGTFHFLDGAKLKFFYRGNTVTCGRCHKDRTGCKGEGFAKTCSEKGGERVSLFDHMKCLWDLIGFQPTSFKLPELDEAAEAAEDIEKKGGDIGLVEQPIPVNNQNVDQTGQNVSGLMVKNLPAEITDIELLDFLRVEIKDDLDVVNYNIHRPDGDGKRSGTKVEIFSGLNSETIHTAFDKLHKNTKLFRLPLYCRKIKNFTPPKVSEKKKKTDEMKGGEPPNEGDGKEGPRQNAKEQPTSGSVKDATPDKIGGNLIQKSMTDFASFTPEEKREFFAREEEELESKVEEISERYDNMGLKNPKTLEFGSYESDDDKNSDPEKEKKEASNSSQKNQKKNKKCQLASPAECNSEAKNLKLSGLPKRKKPSV